MSFDSLYFEFLPPEYQPPGIIFHGEYQTESLEGTYDSYIVDKEGKVYHLTSQGKGQAAEHLSGGFSAAACGTKDEIRLYGIFHRGRLLILLDGEKPLFVDRKWYETFMRTN
ncbi:MAG: hypothetical protein QXW98_04185 [Candidatus Caldarchaeum sp.]